MSLALKPDVKLQGIDPEMHLGHQVVQGVYEEIGIKAMLEWDRSDPGAHCVVTAGIEGRHSATSLHYAGQALDYRTNHLSKEKRDLLLRLCRSRLTADFDVILEKDHLHLEYQPRQVTTPTPAPTAVA